MAKARSGAKKGPSFFEKQFTPKPKPTKLTNKQFNKLPQLSDLKKEEEAKRLDKTGLFKKSWTKSEFAAPTNAKGRNRKNNDEDFRSKNAGDDRPKRSYGKDDTSRSFERGEKKTFTPRGNDDRPKRSYGKDDTSRSYERGEKKTFTARGNDDKPKRTYSKDEAPRSYERGEKKSFTARGNDDRPKRTYGKDEAPRSNERGEKKSFTPRGNDDRPKRTYGKDEAPRSYERGEKKSFTARGNDDKPKRTYGKDEAPRSNERGEKKSFPSRGNDDRPKRTYGKDEAPRSDERGEKKSFTPRGNDDRPKRTYGKDEAPRSNERGEKRSYPSRGDERPKRTYNRDESYNYENTNNDASMPLNKFVSKCGISSRREAVEIIKDGRVMVNGNVISEPAFKVTESDKIKLDGKPLVYEGSLVYLLLNKPKDFITTLSDEKGRKTVLDLVKNACDERIHPIGRLDRNTTGLLLFTNDGDLTQKMSHPKYKVKKIYQVGLDKDLTKSDYESILKGLELEDGIAEVDELAFTDPSDKTKVGVQIHSGKNRIVRRIFETLGYEVKSLDRVIYANLDKKNLPRGKWRFLNETEVRYLKFYNSAKK
jgi:23S rRNA pseudouridine2605 synthase